jgi:hypothetical protein
VCGLAGKGGKEGRSGPVGGRGKDGNAGPHQRRRQGGAYPLTEEAGAARVDPPEDACGGAHSTLSAKDA